MMSSPGPAAETGLGDRGEILESPAFQACIDGLPVELASIEASLTRYDACYISGLLQEYLPFPQIDGEYH